MTAPVVVLDGGTSYHAFSLSDPMLGPWYDQRLYVDDVSAEALAQAGTVVVPCRLNPDWLVAHADLLVEVLRQGRTLIAMGETAISASALPRPITGCSTSLRWTKRPGTITAGSAYPKARCP